MKNMATRSEIRFATREEGVSFNEHPEVIHAKFYAHWDGYPEHRGVEIAESILHGNKINGWEIESLTTNHTDLEYIYYVWQSPNKDEWISVFETKPFSDEEDKCIFVGKPERLIEKYKPNTNKEG